MKIESLKREYDDKHRLYSQLEEEVFFIINKHITESKIKISNIEHRIKTRDSFINKASINNYKNPFVDIDDILGFRIITLFISDIKKITKLLHESFEIINEDDKINTDIRNFGYLSIHLLAKLKNEFKGPRYDSIKDLIFEIQVRTITMNSWANISHFLDYKSDSDIPQELKKDFYALSGLFYVADQHFELFFNQSKKKRALIEKKFEKGNSNILDQEINIYTLQNYLKTKFPERKQSNKNTISILINELTATDYKSLQQLEDAISIGWEAFLQYERDSPPITSDDDKTYADVGVIRGLLEIIDLNFSKHRKATTKNLKKYREMIKGKTSA